MATDDTPAVPPPTSPAESHSPEKSFGILQHELRLATRSSRYALATAVAAALLSAGTSAWASVHVSGTQMDRQERLAREQAIRSDREKAYSDLVANYIDLVDHLGLMRAALVASPPDKQSLDAAGGVQASLAAMEKAEATVKIVGSEMEAVLAHLDAAGLALFQGLGSAFKYAREHDLNNDQNWPRISAVAVAAIDKFVNDHGIDEFAERARADLGSG